MKKLIGIALLALVLSPVSALASTWVTPSGAVVDDFGHLVSLPPKTVLATTSVVVPKKTVTCLYPYKPGTVKYAVFCR